MSNISEAGNMSNTSEPGPVPSDLEVLAFIASALLSEEHKKKYDIPSGAESLDAPLLEEEGEKFLQDLCMELGLDPEDETHISLALRVVSTILKAPPS